ncbi:V-type ATP synthase subunit E [Clostridium sp. DL1XJH146]
MSNISNLVKKIIEEGNSSAEAILSEGRKEEEKILNKNIKEAEETGKLIIEKTTLESVTRGERVISNAELKVRNSKLEAKQKVLDKVFEEALEKLTKISGEEHLKFIEESILALDIEEDEELIIGRDNTDVTAEFVNKINAELVKKGKKAGIKLSSEKRDFKGGFVMQKDGIEINNTFEALIMSLRDELEADVANVLFQ